MTNNSELDATFELTDRAAFQLWKENVKADIFADVKLAMENKLVDFRSTINEIVDSVADKEMEGKLKN